MKSGKIIVLSAPSGTGKSTLIRYLMEKRPDLNLSFSISATSRSPREGEKDGREYYFLCEEEFRSKVLKGEFVEWEEVYAGNLYGTLESEVERLTGDGRNVIMDIDVKGGLNVKRRYGSRALSVFILPPSLDVLRDRLTGRATDTQADIERRLAKAEYEISFAPEFDFTVINDDLDRTAAEIASLIKDHEA